MSGKDLRSLTYKQCLQIFQEMKIPAFRAKQVFQWVQQKRVRDFAEMKNIGKGLQSLLKENFSLEVPEEIRRSVSKDGQTVKFLLKLADGETVETVLMSYRGTKIRARDTVCVSSQVGCAMGCAFCATGLSGWRRNLTTGEIISQVLAAQDFLQQQSRVTNVVFMGMGEPLLNFRSLINSIEILNNPLGLEIGARRMTVSTSGLVPGIYKLAELKLQITLAVSLHAPNNQLRNKLLPINKKYPLEILLKACGDYAEKTGRRVTFEYALIKGINDSQELAVQLAGLMRGKLFNVNLIPINPVTGTEFVPPPKKVIKSFQERLEQSGVSASIREEKGTDIDAACGQLRRRAAGENL